MGCNKDLGRAATRLLEPLAAELLRHDVRFATFVEWARRAFLTAAEHATSGGTHGASSGSVAERAGLPLEDVLRLRAQKRPGLARAALTFGRAARLVTAWTRTPPFVGEDGEPRVLPLENAAASFAQLVQRFAPGAVPRVLLCDLVRAGAVAHLPTEEVRLLDRAYLARRDPSEQLEVLGTDARDLIATIAHNMDRRGRPPYFQRTVRYDNLPPEALPVLRTFVERQAQALLEVLDRCLSAHDRDDTPGIRGTTRRHAGVGIYYFDDDVEQTSREEAPS